MKLLILCLALAIPLSASAFWPFTRHHAKPFRVPPPTLPPALTNVSRADITKALNLARQVKSIGPPPCTTCPHCFNEFTYIEVVPPQVGTYFVTQWDQLQNQWFYDFQVAGSPAGPWTTVQHGLWTSSDTNAYFGLNVVQDQLRCFQRAIGTPMAIVAMENVGAPFMPLMVSYKNQPYRPWWKVRK